MRLLLPIILTAPTVLICALIALGLIFGVYPLSPLSRDWAAVVIFLPLLSFAASLAMIFIKNTRPWRIAVIVNAIPILLVVLAILLGFGR